MTTSDDARSPSDELIVAALVAGLTYTEAAESAGVSAATVYRRMRETAFRSAVAEERTQLVEGIRGKLLAAAPSAVATLLEICEDEQEDGRVRVSAAGKILDVSLLKRNELSRVNVEDFELFARATVDAALGFIAEDNHRAAVSTIADAWRRAAS